MSMISNQILSVLSRNFSCLWRYIFCLICNKITKFWLVEPSQIILWYYYIQSTLKYKPNGKNIEAIKRNCEFNPFNLS